MGRLLIGARVAFARCELSCIVQKGKRIGRGGKEESVNGKGSRKFEAAPPPTEAEGVEGRVVLIRRCLQITFDK